MSDEKKILPTITISKNSDGKFDFSEIAPILKVCWEPMIEDTLQVECEEESGKRIGMKEALDRGITVVSDQITIAPNTEDIDKLEAQWEAEEREARHHTPSFKRAQEVKQEGLWRQLEGVPLQQAIEQWLESISNPRTKRAYTMAMQELAKNRLINPSMSLQGFSMRNHDVTVDFIKTKKLYSSKGGGNVNRQWSEATRQQRAAAFVSFTGFLSRRTEGIIRKATPNKEGQYRTFHRINQHVVTPAFSSPKEWKRFLKELEKINPRDCLIAKIMLQGGKRISEALSLDTRDIDFEKGEITFAQSKTKGEARQTIISYPQAVMLELKEYIGDRKGYAFVTQSGNPVKPQQLERNFKKAGERASIPFKVSPHVLRATTVTYHKKQGSPDSDIMKITGHADSEMIRMYDKSDLADNASKRINLV